MSSLKIPARRSFETTLIQSHPTGRSDVIGGLVTHDASFVEGFEENRSMSMLSLFSVRERVMSLDFEC